MSSLPGERPRSPKREPPGGGSTRALADLSAAQASALLHALELPPGAAAELRALGVDGAMLQGIEECDLFELGVAHAAARSAVLAQLRRYALDGVADAHVAPQPPRAADGARPGGGAADGVGGAPAGLDTRTRMELELLASRARVQGGARVLLRAPTLDFSHDRLETSRHLHAALHLLERSGSPVARLGLASNGSFVRGNLRALAGAIAANGQLVSLDLADDELTDAHVPPIVAAVAASARLRSLSLEANCLGDTAIPPLVGALRERAGFEALNLARNRLTAGAADELGALLGGPALRLELSLSANALTDGAVPALARALQRCGARQRRVLRLASAGLSDAAVPPLARAATHSGVHLELDLADNALSDAAIPPLADALTAGAAVRSLNLARNRLTDAAAPLLAGALKAGARLEALHLEENQLTDGGVPALVEAITATSSALTELGVLSRNRGLSVAGKARLKRAAQQVLRGAHSPAASGRAGSPARAAPRSNGAAAHPAGHAARRRELVLE